jgi:hypothetical protein
MARNKNDQSGYGVVIIVVAVLIIGLIIGTGWFIMNKKDGMPKSATEISKGNTKLEANPELKQAQSMPSATEIDKNLVKIPELGIQMTVPDSIKDLTYKAYTGGQVQGRPAAAARFSTAALTTLDAKCGPDEMPLGSISTVQGQYPGDSNDINNIDKYGKLFKQFPESYVIVGSPQAGCSVNNKEALAAQSAYRSDFSTAKETIEPLK